jgi:hypothetical protein
MIIIGVHLANKSRGEIETPATLGQEVKTMAIEKKCYFKDKEYSEGSVVCIGDQCIQCMDGKWGPNEFEQRSRERNLY